jgi:hypothetical protein
MKKINKYKINLQTDHLCKHIYTFAYLNMLTHIHKHVFTYICIYTYFNVCGYVRTYVPWNTTPSPGLIDDLQITHKSVVVDKKYSNIYMHVHTNIFVPWNTTPFPQLSDSNIQISTCLCIYINIYMFINMYLRTYLGTLPHPPD